MGILSIADSFFDAVLVFTNYRRPLLPAADESGRTQKWRWK